MLTNGIPIVHIITTLDRGGAESQLLILAKQQVEQGLTVVVLFLKGRGELVENFQLLGIPVVRVSSWNFFPWQVFKMKWYLRKKIKKFHVVHAHLPQAELVAAFSHTSKTRLINSRHFGGDFHPTINKKISRFLGKLATRKSYKVIAISNSVKNLLIKQREVRDNVPIQVVYYGFERKVVGEFFLPEQNRKEGVIRLGTVARLSPEKDLETLIGGFKLVTMSKKGVKLEVVGVGNQLQKLKSLVAELNLTESVFFLGKTSQVESFMSSLDLFILTSKFEGFGMVLLEAMNVNCKIVAARNSAIPEVLGDSGAGLFFQTGDKYDLADKILNSLDDDNYSYKQKQNRQLEKFSAKKMADQMLLAYNLFNS